MRQRPLRFDTQAEDPRPSNGSPPAPLPTRPRMDFRGADEIFRFVVAFVTERDEDGTLIYPE